MKDLFREYRNQKIKTHALLAWVAVCLAVWINIFINSSPASYIGANMLAGQNQESPQNLADIQFSEENNILFLRALKNFENVSSLSFSLAYNPDSLAFHPENISSDFVVQVLENDPGYTTFLLQSAEGKNIIENSEILALPFEKLWNEIAFVNPIELYFIDANGQTFVLSSENLMIE